MPVKRLLSQWTLCKNEAGAVYQFLSFNDCKQIGERGERSTEWIWCIKTYVRIVDYANFVRFEEPELH
jgi:hypothetical protein